MSEGPLFTAGLLVLAALAYVGVLRWLRALLARARPLAADATTLRGGLIFLVGAVCLLAASISLGLAFDLDEDTTPLGAPLAVQSLAALWAAAVMLAMAARQPGGVATLGVRRPQGRPGTRAPSVLAFSLAAWLAFLPVFFGAGALSYLLQWSLGREPEPQSYIQDFLVDADARRSTLVWLAIVVVNPLFEELIFRGALFGALRRRAPAWLAMLISAVLFAALHEIDVALQVACLGLLLAWAYERTGSLAAPCVIHMLHNGVVLLMVASGWLEV